MINSININTAPVKSVEQSLPSKVADALPQKSTQASETQPTQPLQTDTAQVSRFSQYMGTLLKDTPEVRPDRVANAKKLLEGKTNYPPLDIIAAISNLVGNSSGIKEKV